MLSPSYTPSMAQRQKMWTSQTEFSKKLLVSVIKTRLSAQEHLMNNNYNKYLTVSRLVVKIQDYLKIEIQDFDKLSRTGG